MTWSPRGRIFLYMLSCNSWAIFGVSDSPKKSTLPVAPAKRTSPTKTICTSSETFLSVIVMDMLSKVCPGVSKTFISIDPKLNVSLSYTGVP